MATTTTTTNKPLNPRAQDLSPKGYNRAALYSGKALDFDGVNDDINVTPAPIGAESAVSFSGYLKTTQSFSSVKGIISKGTNGFGDFVIAGRGTDKLGVYFQTNSASGGYHLSTTSINDGEWYFFTVTWENSSDNLKIYINGSLENTQTIAGDSVKNTDTKLAIGAFSNDSNYFDGELANVKIFNTALTAAQVADLYLNPEKIVPDGVASSALKLWLPMMEGAGTTAYDGSGNGNDGTINGATWVSGIGAPVAQTALVSWNKGTNLVQYSEQFDNAAWGTSNTTVTADVETAPDGTLTADTMTIINSTSFIQQVVSFGAGTYTVSCYVKAISTTTAGAARFNLVVDGVASSNEFIPTTEWQRVTATFTAASSLTTVRVRGQSFVGTLAIWGAQLEAVDSLGPYIPTLATAQTSPVLLPQGLTANKDITGVNAFESARNPYALNLDGASWAEVHDNASLDFGTGSFTLEAWAKAKFVNAGSALNVVLNLGGNASSAGAVSMFVGSTNKVTAVYNNSYLDSNTILTEGEWYHLVVNFNGTHSQIYVNGAFDKNIARTAADISNALVKEIGRDSTTTRTYKDQIALPRIYNRALTATEVLRNYNADKSKFGL
jgi:hypothetical protein